MALFDLGDFHLAELWAECVFPLTEIFKLFYLSVVRSDDDPEADENDVFNTLRTNWGQLSGDLALKYAVCLALISYLLKQRPDKPKLIAGHPKSKGDRDHSEVEFDALGDVRPPDMPADHVLERICELSMDATEEDLACIWDRYEFFAIKELPNKRTPLKRSIIRRAEALIIPDGWKNHDCNRFIFAIFPRFARGALAKLQNANRASKSFQISYLTTQKKC
jgi:hypothetical protein